MSGTGGDETGATGAPEPVTGAPERDDTGPDDGPARRRRAVLAVAGQLRDLPWRRSRDPWAVLVSEVMLQQTQVSRVAPAWAAFMARFPTPADCAEAGVGEVLRAWAGLGYHRRARDLHATARAVVARHQGVVPGDLAALLALPGVGPYTARAVLAFAYEAPVAVVDTNVRRVLVRAVAGEALAPAALQALADRLVPPERSWEWNQALIELGARHCRATRPGCERCPLAGECRWRAEPGAPDPWRPARTQSRFAGSDRQGRGRLVAALRAGPVPLRAVPAAAGWPDDPRRAEVVAAGLVRDGLARVEQGTMMLP